MSQNKFSVYLTDDGGTVFTRLDIFDGNPTLGIRNIIDVEVIIISEIKIWKAENKNESGGACARGAKRPRVGVLTRFVSVFVFVLIFGFSIFYFIRVRINIPSPSTL